MRLVSKSIFKELYHPPARSHKGQNGELLVIGGSARYHGAPLLAARMAAKIVDFVYFSSTPENNQLVRAVKQGLAEFIAVPRRLIYQYAKHSDCILIGPGLGLDRGTQHFVNRMMQKFPQKKFVLDAGAIRLVEARRLGPQCVLTPHRKEFQALFQRSATFANVRAMSKKYKCIIVLKGSEDIICRPQGCMINRTGNAGMTKGGTGDVLAGLIAGLACKNDLFLAACAGAYVNGQAGDQLFKKSSYYFSASDLIGEIPQVLKGYCKNLRGSV